MWNVSADPRRFDESHAPDGSPRPHWSRLVRAFDHLGINELQARGETARKFLRENGVTYNVYGDAKGFERTWALDPIPLIIPAAEWASIERGLVQRARLLDRILGDLYGRQQLLADRLLPPALVFSNPAFLRPCHSGGASFATPLFLHAVDLARGPDGRWRVLADRTQAPSGAGYALVNRIALSRAFPDEFRDCHVQRLASFFQTERDALRALAPRNRENPHIVLLTPGPYNEAYFEHAYLARYLGFTLVEGGDLTVRNRCVFIKTLEGLRPVDVIVRRVDDSYCDPLELRADSQLGIPGLVEAARAGNVAIANPLGSGIVETPALLPFLPAICRALLGEELLLHAVPTWWCGLERDREHALANLQDMVVKRAFRSGSSEPLFVHNLDPERIDALKADLRNAPESFVVQENTMLSQAPALADRSCIPHPVVLRAYVCACPHGYQVMPGGLTRVSPEPGGAIVSTQRGGSSKDTWVLSDGPVSGVTLLRPPDPVVRAERRPAEVPSRVADNCFWLGRYAERVEDTIRIIRVALSRLAGESAAGLPPEIPALVRMLAALELFPGSESQAATPSCIEKNLLLLIYKTHRPGSIREALNRLRHIAFVVRDRFTADTWRIFNKLQIDAAERPRHLPLTESLALLNTLIFDLSAFNGMAMENMTRGHSWLFLNIGRRLERALHILSLLHAAVSTDPSGEFLLEPALEIADSVMTYRVRYFARPQLSGVLDLLVLDETNPRSIAAQFESLLHDIHHLPPAPHPADTIPLATRLQGTAARVCAANAIALAECHGPGPNPDLLHFLKSVQHDLQSVSDDLTLRYFTHAAPRSN